MSDPFNPHGPATPPMSAEEVIRLRYATAALNPANRGMQAQLEAMRDAEIAAAQAGRPVGPGVASQFGRVKGPMPQVPTLLGEFR